MKANILLAAAVAAPSASADGNRAEPSCDRGLYPLRGAAERATPSFVGIETASAASSPRFINSSPTHLAYQVLTEDHADNDTFAY